MVVRVLGKILKALLFKAGLWAPTVFAAVYGCLVAFAGLPFSGAGMGVGCVAAWVLGVTASIAVYKRNHIDTVGRTNIREVRKAEPTVRVRPAEQPPETPKDTPRITADEKALARKYDLQLDDRPEVEPEPAPKSADDGVSEKTAAYGKADAKEIFDAERDRLWQRLEGVRQARNEQADEEERPYAYASRHDPNLFIYEYTDRLEFYRRMGDEMILTSTEYKTEGAGRAVR